MSKRDRSSPQLAARVFLKSIGEEVTNERVEMVCSLFNKENKEQLKSLDQLTKEREKAIEERKETEQLLKEIQKIKDSVPAPEIIYKEVEVNDSDINCHTYAAAYNLNNKCYDLYKIGLNSNNNTCKIIEVKPNITNFTPRINLELNKLIGREVLEQEKRRRK